MMVPLKRLNVDEVNEVRNKGTKERRNEGRKEGRKEGRNERRSNLIYFLDP
jgi:flagellar biosynthesis/type III secretory pathway protein FliH